jgi:hypothetical protein
MTPSEWYRTRAAAWATARAAHGRDAVIYSRWRLASFFGAAAACAWAWHARPGAAAALVGALGIAGFVAFALLVRQHARVLDRLARAEAGHRYSELGLARIARDWAALPDIPAPPHVDLETHPYARDLDLFGHASLTKWLGRTATLDGARTLHDWLLGASRDADIAARQAAVDELASEREWREALAIEGSLASLDPSDFASFLDWTAGTRSAVPPFMRAAAVALPLATFLLLGLFLLGATDGAWWLLPLAGSIVLSFIFEAAAFHTFDRAWLGDRGLSRYGTMLALVSDASWSAPLLAALQARVRDGGPAPEAVRRLASLSGWAQLRSGAALLHFPVQAFTMWDFHVLFAMERWRARSGRHVRRWLDALGTIDALSVLAIPRADEPAWTLPAIDPAADALDGRGVGHPLIAATRRVSNDVRVGPAGTLLLVTGSNMSGKSTLLRAIGLNTVLAQAGSGVCAEGFRMPPIALQTSIRVQDSLELGLSYFMAALARLKQIVDAAARHTAEAPGGARLFYLLDEVLQGTNSVERGIAVRAVAAHLLEAGAIGAMTTHDLALAGEEPFVSRAVLVHFTEQLAADGTMTFDYRLRPGLATSTNALRLMQAIGITPDTR